MTKDEVGGLHKKKERENNAEGSEFIHCVDVTEVQKGTRNSREQ